MAEDHDYSQSNVPQEQRRGFWAMFVVMLGFTFFSASMWTGTTLGNGLTVSKFFLAVLLGNLILGAYTSALAYMASSTGLSVHLLARRSFGKRGSALPSAILAITQIGWFGVGVAMCAFPIVTYLKEKGVECNIWIPVIISGILFTTSAYFGIKALTIVSLVAVPAIAIGGGFSALKVFCDNPDAWNTLKNFTPAGDKALTLSAAVALTIGSFISGGTCTPDFVRFAKDRKIAVSTTAIAFFIGNSLMFLFGAVGGMFYNTNDISNVLVAQGLLVPGIIVLTFNIWTTNDNALYTSGLGLANITGFPKKYLVLICGTLGTIFRRRRPDGRLLRRPPQEHQEQRRTRQRQACDSGLGDRYAGGQLRAVWLQGHQRHDRRVHLLRVLCESLRRPQGSGSSCGRSSRRSSPTLE